MLRLTPRRNRRIPNGLAILGAVLLAASVLAGTGNAIPGARQQASTEAGTEAGTEASTEASTEVTTRDSTSAITLAGTHGSAIETDHTVSEAAVTRTRKFRVNLFLFRH